MPLDVVFDALANEARREIVARLAGGPTTTPDIRQAFSFSKQALSKHMAILEEAGLVRRSLRGRVHELTLVRAPLGEISDWLTEIRRGWQANLDRLDVVLRNRFEEEYR